jgi:hypothetical protein
MSRVLFEGHMTDRLGGGGRVMTVDDRRVRAWAWRAADRVEKSVRWLHSHLQPQDTTQHAGPGGYRGLAAGRRTLSRLSGGCQVRGEGAARYGGTVMSMHLFVVTRARGGDCIHHDRLSYLALRVASRSGAADGR